MDFNKGLNIICGPINSGKTSTMVNLVNLESETKNVLFISLEAGFNILIDRYKISGKDSITIIDHPTSINTLDEELTNNKYDIIYIDYIMLLQTEVDTYEEKIKALVELSKKHETPIVASDLLGINDSLDKYKTELFKDVETVQTLEMIL